MLQQKPRQDETDEERTGIETVRTAELETLATHVAECPVCDASVVDGQGVLGCTGCDWVGRVA